MKRTAIIYGLISGVVVSTFMSTRMIATANDTLHCSSTASMVIGYLGMLIAFTFIFVAIKSYRDKNSNGLISFGKAFSMGLLIALIASTMYVITWAIVYKYFLPDFMDKYTATMVQQAKDTLSGAALQAKIDELNKAKQMYATPLGFTLFTYAEILPVGILVSLVAALILKRKEPRVALA